MAEGFTPVVLKGAHLARTLYPETALRPMDDVDVLVEFEPGRVPGLAFFAMEAELGDILQRKVELSTPSFLSRYIRDEVMAEAQVQYDARG